MAKEQTTLVERDAFSVDEFCQRHSICRANFYNLLKDGQGPKIIKLGRRTLVSREAAQAWRADREAASNCGHDTTVAA